MFDDNHQRLALYGKPPNFHSYIMYIASFIEKVEKSFSGIIILQVKIGLLNQYYIEGVKDNHKMGSAWWNLFS